MNNGVRDERKVVHAITGAVVHPEPGKQIEDAVVLFQNGTVLACGKSLPIPADAVLHPRCYCSFDLTMMNAKIALSYGSPLPLPS